MPPAPFPNGNVGLTRTMAIVLAGGAGTRLHELTATECKPALPFAGRRFLADFTLANVVRSGVPHIIVATQYQPKTLVQHLTSHWSDAFIPGGLMLRDGRGVTASPMGYRGTADAVTANIADIDAAGVDDVIVLSGDHVHAMDYAPMIADHRRSKAEVTVAVCGVPVDTTGPCDTVAADDAGLITRMAEAPTPGLPNTGQSDQPLVSMGIYVFSWPWLRAKLLADRADPASSHDLCHDILPQAVARRGALAFRFTGTDGGAPYWRDIDTLDAYRLAQLDFAADPPPCALPDEVHATTHSAADIMQFGFEMSAGGLALRAPRYLPGVPGRWTVLDGTVLLPDARVMPGARLTHCIVAQRTIVPAGLVVGEDPVEDARWFRRTQAGTTLITTTMLAQRSAKRVRPVTSRWPFSIGKTRPRGALVGVPAPTKGHQENP